MSLILTVWGVLMGLLSNCAVGSLPTMELPRSKKKMLPFNVTKKNPGSFHFDTISLLLTNYTFTFQEVNFGILKSYNGGEYRTEYETLKSV